MLNKKRVITGSVIALCLCIAVIFTVKNINKKEAPVVDIDKEEKVEEEKKEEVIVPPITDEEEQGQKEETVKEEVKNIDGEEVLTKSAPKPKEKNLPEAVQKPVKKEKPTDPPTPPVKDTTTDTTAEDKHPEYPKEEKPQVVKGGTGEDGVLRDLQGNPIHVEGDPNAKPNEVKSSDLLEPGDPQGEMGQGDKF